MLWKVNKFSLSYWWFQRLGEKPASILRNPCINYGFVRKLPVDRLHNSIKNKFDLEMMILKRNNVVFNISAFEKNEKFMEKFCLMFVIWFWLDLMFWFVRLSWREEINECYLIFWCFVGWKNAGKVWNFRICSHFFFHVGFN